MGLRSVPMTLAEGCSVAVQCYLLSRNLQDNQRSVIPKSIDPSVKSAISNEERSTGCADIFQFPLQYQAHYGFRL